MILFSLYGRVMPLRSSAFMLQTSAALAIGSVSIVISNFTPNTPYVCQARVFSFKAVSPPVTFAAFELQREFTSCIGLLESVVVPFFKYCFES